MQLKIIGEDDNAVSYVFRENDYKIQHVIVHVIETVFLFFKAERILFHYLHYFKDIV